MQVAQIIINSMLCKSLCVLLNEMHIFYKKYLSTILLQNNYEIYQLKKQSHQPLWKSEGNIGIIVNLGSQDGYFELQQGKLIT